MHSTCRALPQDDENILPAGGNMTTTVPAPTSDDQFLPSQGPINDEIPLQMTMLPGQGSLDSAGFDLDARFLEPLFNDGLELSDALPWPALPHLSQLENDFCIS